MIRSMTGFGTGEQCGGGWQVHVTARSLNHRYRTVRVRTPRDWPQLQTQVEEAVKGRLDRGDVTVWIVASRHTEEDGTWTPNPGPARDAMRALRDLATELGLPQEPTLTDLIQLGVLQDAWLQETPPWKVVHDALEIALDGVIASREAEGAALRGELVEILGGLTQLLGEVTERVPEVTEELRERLRQRIDSLDLSVDPSRMETEVALLAERYDVREEVRRIDGHLARSRRLLEGDGPVGRQLDFLSQELLREVNTLGSKSRDLAIHNRVLDMKVAIDRLKEQAQNVE
jgi:uncharacterized protein (TIGR00255 family)